MKKKILFIINPISGGYSKKGYQEIIHSCLDTSKCAFNIVLTQAPGHATKIVNEYKNSGIDTVVAIGGDGTVNEVARELVHTNIALGIVPCGSGNGLARHLGIPMDIKKAISIINTGNVEVLDYGMINENPFFCTCGVGFDAFISLKFATSRKRGALTYVENVLKEILTYKPETYEVSDETGNKTYKAFLIACANASQYGNNAYIAPNATMTDGFLDVIIMEPFDILDAPQISVDMFAKTLDKNAKIKTFRTKKLNITRVNAGAIHYDGDPMMAGKSIDIHVEEKGIHIITNPLAEKIQTVPNAFLYVLSEFFGVMNDIRTTIEERGKQIENTLRKKLKK